MMLTVADSGDPLMTPMVVASLGISKSIVKLSTHSVMLSSLMVTLKLTTFSPAGKFTE